MADALEYIGLGTVDNDGTGDSLKTAGEKVNRHIRRTIGRNIPKSADFNLLAENCNDFIICDTTSADITVTFKLEDETDYLYPDNSTLRLINIGINDLILDGEIVGEDEVTITGNFVIKKYCVVDIRYLGDNEWIVDNSSVNPSKAAASDINTGTDDDKFVTSKAIADSNLRGLSISRSLNDSANLASGDIGKCVIMDAAAAKTLTIPEALMVEGETIAVLTIGAGQVTIAVANGSDQAINTACKTPGQDTMIAIYCIDDTADDEVFKVIGGIA
jgi:hypothetical protein